MKRPLLLLLVLIAPTLMAPSDPGCPVCTVVSLWSGTLSAYQNATHTKSVLASTDYRVELLPNRPSSLDVTGPISGLNCEPSGFNTVCTFTASNNGTVSLKATAGSEAVAYDLYLLLPD